MSRDINNKYPRGSEWRKWDLHFHTPASKGILNDDWCEEYIKRINILDINVIAITDYFTLNGYKSLKKNYDKINKVIFPGIELRLKDSLLPTRHEQNISTDKPIHLQIIFDNDENLLNIIDEFVRSLSFEDFYNKNRELTYENIIQLGKDCGKSINDSEAFKKGIENIRISLDLIRDNLTKKGLKNYSLIILPYEKYGGIDKIDPENDSLIKSKLTKFAHFIESSNDIEKEFFLGNSKILPYILEDGTVNSNFTKFIGVPKPCITGSDAHSIDKIGKYPDNKICWIKSDPTFNGLKQTIYEPSDRIYIGKSYPQQKNQSYILDKIIIKNSHNWFDEVPVLFNENLVAIIGEKGAGKTALAELIALAAGDFHIIKNEMGNFIHKALVPTKQINETIENAEINLIWKDNSSDVITITEDLSNYEDKKKVKYLSQSFIERKCSPEAAEEIQEDIENLIFQYIPIIDRFNQTTFKDLKKIQTQSIKIKKDDVKIAIYDLNKKIFELESEVVTLNEKKKERARLIKENEDLESQKPKPDTDEEKKIENILTILSNRKNEIDKDVSDLKEQLTVIDNINTKIDKLNIFIEGKLIDLKKDLKFLNLENLIDELKFIITEKFWTEIGSTKEKISKYIQNFIGNKISEKEEKNLDINLTTLEEFTEDYVSKFNLEKVNYLITSLESRSSLAESQRVAIKKFEDIINKNKKRIEELNKNIEFIEKEALKLLQNFEKDRDDKYKSFIDLMVEEKLILESLYSPLRKRMSFDKNISTVLLEFFARIELDSELFFNRAKEIINFSKCRYYHQEEEKLLKDINDIGEKIEISEEKDIFSIIKKLYKKFISSTNHFNEIQNQLKKNKNVFDFYNWIFDVSIFNVSYGIKYQGTNLELLSAGKKGIVLLLIFLALDTEGSIPLIIDQPEENLDNKSVYSNLVNFFKEVKKRRQIIIITHNPNLVLNTDAEQVIVANFEAIPKYQNSRIKYISGSLENSFIRDQVQSPLNKKGIKEHGIDLLEGGDTAFKKRRDKYDLKNNS